MSKRVFENTTCELAHALDEQDDNDKNKHSTKRRRTEPIQKKKNNVYTTNVSISHASKPNLWLQLVSCGYVRRGLSYRNIMINPIDIAYIIAKFLNEQWKFDYCHCYCAVSKASMPHCIENNGKTLKCNQDSFICNCFFGSFSFGMKPNSGNYKIKFLINTIFESWANIIGIVSQNGKNEIITKCIELNSNGNYNK